MCSGTLTPTDFIGFIFKDNWVSVTSVSLSFDYYNCTSPAAHQDSNPFLQFDGMRLPFAIDFGLWAAAYSGEIRFEFESHLPCTGHAKRTESTRTHRFHSINYADTTHRNSHWSSLCRSWKVVLCVRRHNVVNSSIPPFGIGWQFFTSRTAYETGDHVTTTMITMFWCCAEESIWAIRGECGNTKLHIRDQSTHERTGSGYVWIRV